MGRSIQFALHIQGVSAELRLRLGQGGWVVLDHSPPGFSGFEHGSAVAVRDLLDSLRRGEVEFGGLLTLDDDILGAIEPQARALSGVWMQRSLAAFLVERGVISAGILYDPRPFDLKEPLFVKGKSGRLPLLKRYARLSPFYGRLTERQEVARALAMGRLVSVVGSPGIGKTALLRVLQDDLAGEFDEGVWYIDVAQVSSEFLLIPIIGRTVFAKEQGQVAQALEFVGLSERIGQSNSLLILDNSEHLAKHVGEFAVQMLSQCPNLSILVGSRIRIPAGEQTSITLGPLEVPTEMSDLDSLQEESAVALFIDRAQTVDPYFEFDQESATAVIGICQKLDGNPMAIELAARKMSYMTASQIFHRLGDRFLLLKSDSEDERQATLEKAIQWSYERLSATAKEFYLKLCWLEASFNPEQLSEIFGDTDQPDIDIEGSFEQLIDHSFLTFSKEFGGLKYFQLPESQRLFGRALSTKAAWLPELLNRIDRYLIKSTSSISEVGMELIYPDVRASVQRLVRNKEWDVASELILNTFYFWWGRGFASEGREQIQILLEKSGRSKLEYRDRLYNALSYLARLDGDMVERERYARKALRAAYQTGKTDRLFLAMLNYGKIRSDAKPLSGVRWQKRVLKLADLLGDTEYQTLALQALDRAFAAMDRYLESIALMLARPELLESDSTLQNNLSVAFLRTGDLESAKKWLVKTAIAAVGEMDIFSALTALDTHSEFFARSGDLERAFVINCAIERLAIEHGYLPTQIVSAYMSAYKVGLPNSMEASDRMIYLHSAENMTLKDLKEYCLDAITGKK